MGTLDYIILVIVAVWFLAAMRSILKKKGGCGCCGGSGTKHASCGCSGCAESSCNCCKDKN